MNRSTAIRSGRNLLVLVGMVFLARLADFAVDGYASAVLPHSFSGSFAIFFGILLLELPTLLVFFGASMLLCVVIDTPGHWTWAAALGALPMFERLAWNIGLNTTSWEFDALTGTAFVLALTAPIVGALLGWLAWRRLSRTPTPVTA